MSPGSLKRRYSISGHPSGTNEGKMEPPERRRFGNRRKKRAEKAAKQHKARASVPKFVETPANVLYKQRWKQPPGTTKVPPKAAWSKAFSFETSLEKKMIPKSRKKKFVKTFCTDKDSKVIVGSNRMEESRRYNNGSVAYANGRIPTPFPGHSTEITSLSKAKPDQKVTNPKKERPEYLSDEEDNDTESTHLESPFDSVKKTFEMEPYRPITKNQTTRPSEMRLESNGQGWSSHISSHNARDEGEALSPLKAKNLDWRKTDADYGTDYKSESQKAIEFPTVAIDSSKANLLSKKESFGENNSTSAMGVSPMSVFLKRVESLDQDLAQQRQNSTINGSNKKLCRKVDHEQSCEKENVSASLRSRNHPHTIDQDPTQDKDKLKSKRIDKAPKSAPPRAFDLGLEYMKSKQAVRNTNSKVKKFIRPKRLFGEAMSQEENSVQMRERKRRLSNQSAPHRIAIRQLQSSNKVQRSGGSQLQVGIDSEHSSSSSSSQSAPKDPSEIDEETMRRLTCRDTDIYGRPLGLCTIEFIRSILEDTDSNSDTDLENSTSTSLNDSITSRYSRLGRVVQQSGHTTETQEQPKVTFNDKKASEADIVGAGSKDYDSSSDWSNIWDDRPAKRSANRSRNQDANGKQPESTSSDGNDSKAPNPVVLQQEAKTMKDAPETVHQTATESVSRTKPPRMKQTLVSQPIPTNVTITAKNPESSLPETNVSTDASEVAHLLSAEPVAKPKSPNMKLDVVQQTIPTNVTIKTQSRDSYAGPRENDWANLVWEYVDGPDPPSICSAKDLTPRKSPKDFHISKLGLGSPKMWMPIRASSVFLLMVFFAFHFVGVGMSSHLRASKVAENFRSRNNAMYPPSALIFSKNPNRSLLLASPMLQNTAVL